MRVPLPLTCHCRGKMDAWHNRPPPIIGHSMNSGSSLHHHRKVPCMDLPVWKHFENLRPGPVSAKNVPGLPFLSVDFATRCDAPGITGGRSLKSFHAGVSADKGVEIGCPPICRALRHPRAPILKPTEREHVPDALQRREECMHIRSDQQMPLVIYH